MCLLLRFSSLIIQLQVIHFLLLTHIVSSFKNVKIHHHFSSSKMKLSFVSLNKDILLQHPLDIGSITSNSFQMTTRDKRYSLVHMSHHSKTNSDSVIKKGKLYFTIWASIYSTCLFFIYYFVDNDFLQAEKYGIDSHAFMSQLCDWLDNHVINVGWITRPLRTNPWMTTFAEAYLLTDVVPTTLIAVAAYPFVTRFLPKTKES